MDELITLVYTTYLLTHEIYLHKIYKTVGSFSSEFFTVIKIHNVIEINISERNLLL